MKKEIVLSFMLMSILGKSQEASVEKHLLGFGIGFSDLITFQYEAELARKTTLKTEIGLTYGTTAKGSYQGNSKSRITAIAPIITLEPRWYYSLDRRSKKGKKTYHNSANFISLKTFYAGYSTPVSQNGHVDIASIISIVPSYGIRRAFAKHFYYEFSIGVGYQYNIFKGNECDCFHHSVGGDSQVRIGYNF